MKIRNAKGRSKGSGYGRLFNDDKLGELFSKSQATVISNGTELECLLVSLSKSIKDLDAFIENVENNETEHGVYICTKKVLKKSKYSIEKIEPDLLLFIVGKKHICRVIELKDGDTFDTKKSEAEKKNLEKFSKEFGCSVPFVVDYFICSFNQLDKKLIHEGFKKAFSYEHIMTGKELCDLLSIDYDKIIEQRKIDAEDNVQYFIEKLVSLDNIREMIQEELKIYR